MAQLNFKSAFTFLFIFITSFTFSQGCSDAGFCTLDSFKPIGNDSIKTTDNQVKFGFFFGGADNSISVYGNYLEYNRRLNDKFGIDLKVTTLGQSGNDIKVFGVSDIFVNGNYKVNKKLKFTLGTKIPLTDANKKENNIPLPMDYQASLGTFDLIFGLGYEIKKIQFVAATQIPLTQNDNQFLASDYPVTSELFSFQSTNNFKRSSDVLLRVSYPFSLSEKINLTPSLLPIYHLANDKYTDEFNVKREIVGSEGLTLNGNLYLDYKINNQNFLQFNVGVPFVVRDSRPDGLTRSFIANIEYHFNF